MRKLLILLPAALSAAAAQAAPPPPAPAPSDNIQSVLTDPATADKLGRAMQAMSGAFLNLPIGEVEAAIEGRAPTAADKRRTIRDSGRAADPDFDRNVARQMVGSRAAMQSGMKALATALPAMSRAMGEMQRELEQAVANLPRPDYPRR